MMRRRSGIHWAATLRSTRMDGFLSAFSRLRMSKTSDSSIQVLDKPFCEGVSFCLKQYRNPSRRLWLHNCNDNDVM